MVNLVTKRRVRLTGEVAYVLALLGVVWAIGTADLGLAVWLVLPLLLVTGGCYLSCVRG